MRTTMILSLMAITLPLQPAVGQDVVMRKTLSMRSDASVPTPAASPTPVASPTPTPPPPVLVPFWTYSEWSVMPPLCGYAERTRTATCRTSAGIVADRVCETKIGLSDGVSQTYYDTQGCKGTWHPGDWSAWSSTCAPSSGRSRTVECVAEGQADIKLDASFCRDAKPSTSESSQVLSGCRTVDWETGSWSAPATLCGTSTNTRSVTCRATPPSEPAFQVAAAACSKTMPSSTETVLLSNCSSIVTNPGFETGQIGPWTGNGVSQYTVEGADNWGTEGNYTGKLLEGQSLSQSMSGMLAGGRYRITFSMRPTRVIANSTLSVTAGNATRTYARVSSDISWQPTVIEFTASSPTVIRFTATQGIFYFDKVVVTPLG